MIFSGPCGGSHLQRNMPGRRLHEARGSVLAPETDRTANEEREPDALYLWTNRGRSSRYSIPVVGFSV